MANRALFGLLLVSLLAIPIWVALGVTAGKTLHRDALGVLPVTVLAGPSSEWTGRRPGGGTLTAHLYRSAQGEWFLVIDADPKGGD